MGLYQTKSAATGQIRQKHFNFNRPRSQDDHRQTAVAVDRTDRLAKLQAAANASVSPRVAQAKAAILGSSGTPSPDLLQSRIDPSRVGALPDTLPVVQRIQTLYHSVAEDLLHRDRGRLFDRLGASLRRVRGQWYDSRDDKYEAYRTSLRNGATFSYADLSNAPNLANAGHLTALAGSAQENMYVHEGDTIYRANRGNEKRPHPCLVGGDPDVTGAGTLIVRDLGRQDHAGRDIYDVAVTNNSGHFQPDDVEDSTIDLVRDAADTARPANVAIGVRKRAT